MLAGTLLVNLTFALAHAHLSAAMGAAIAFGNVLIAIIFEATNRFDAFLFWARP
jgi:hypothetical protein